MGASVPIRAFLDDNRAFDPDDLKALGKAFSAALHKLGLDDLKDPAAAEGIARRIIRAAVAGERDPTKLAEIGAGGGE
jgi:hypothetical protein